MRFIKTSFLPFSMVTAFFLFFVFSGAVFGQGNIDKEKYQSYWPMHLNNWWVYRTIAPPDCRNSGGKPAKSAWWVVPPDFSWRLENSRQLRMFKEKPCAWNWVNFNFNVRWAVTTPLSDAFGKKWFAHRGVSLYCPNPSKELRSLPGEDRPPFVDNNSYFMDDENVMDYQPTQRSSSHYNNANFCQKPTKSFDWEESSRGPQRSSFGRGAANDYYPPYLFFPYSPGFPHEMKYGVRFTCGAKLLDSQNTWGFLKGAVSGKCTLNNTEGRWFVKYIEDVPVEVNMRNGSKRTFDTLKFRVFEPNPSWDNAACENWYFAEGVGPVRIEGAAIPMYTKNQLNEYRGRLKLSVPASNWEEYAKSSFEKRCLPFDFSEEATVDFSDSYLDSSGINLSGAFFEALREDSGVNQILIKDQFLPSRDSAAYHELRKRIDKKILAYRYAVISLYDYHVKEEIKNNYHFQDYDSPDVMATTSFFSSSKNPGEHKEIFYVKDGKYWILNIDTGQWIAYGDLERVWGVGGSNASGVSVNGQLIYPWSDGGPKALVFGQKVKNLFGYPALIVNGGAYWLWDYNTCQPNKCVWKQSGLVSDLFGTNYQVLLKNGVPITPYDHKGPRAINEAWWDKSGLEVWNEGGWWYYNKDQGWKEAKLITDMPIKDVPYIGGRLLTEPESVIGGRFFKYDVYAGGGNPVIPSSYQKIFSQHGRYWINYRGIKSDLKWEKWGVGYGDLNGDDRKNGKDLQLLLLRYGSSDQDLEKVMPQEGVDGVVNSIDFIKMVSGSN